MENLERDVLSATVDSKCGFYVPPQHDSADALRRSDHIAPGMGARDWLTVRTVAEMLAVKVFLEYLEVLSEIHRGRRWIIRYKKYKT